MCKSIVKNVIFSNKNQDSIAHYYMSLNKHMTGYKKYVINLKATFNNWLVCANNLMTLCHQVSTYYFHRLTWEHCLQNASQKSHSLSVKGWTILIFLLFNVGSIDVFQKKNCPLWDDFFFFWIWKGDAIQGGIFFYWQNCALLIPWWGGQASPALSPLLCAYKNGNDWWKDEEIFKLIRLASVCKCVRACVFVCTSADLCVFCHFGLYISFFQKHCLCSMLGNITCNSFSDILFTMNFNSDNPHECKRKGGADCQNLGMMPHHCKCKCKCFKIFTWSMM